MTQYLARESKGGQESVSYLECEKLHEYNMSDEDGERPTSKEIAEKIKAAVEDRVAKELARVVESMKEAAQGAGSSISMAGGGKSIPLIMFSRKG